jgi:hypothetical protein
VANLPDYRLFDDDGALAIGHRALISRYAEKALHCVIFDSHNYYRITKRATLMRWLFLAARALPNLFERRLSDCLRLRDDSYRFAGLKGLHSGSCARHCCVLLKRILRLMNN